MEGAIGNSPSSDKLQSEVSTSRNDVKKPPQDNASSSAFVNHAAIDWQRKRKEWVGDQSHKKKKIAKDPILSWSMTYEDMLSTNEPFVEPIPLPEMVDFLVDIWHDEGLYD